MRKLYVFVLFVISVSLGLRAELKINEIMQSNVDCLLDNTNEFPDSWVEVYNDSDAAVSLSGYFLGESSDLAEASALPDVSVAARDYVVIYCDKKTGGLHLPFRVDSSKGGAIYLFKDSKIVDSVTALPKMITPNVSIGRNGAGEWVWQLVATPGAENCKDVCKGILPEPIFSRHGAVNPDPFTLDISVMAGSPAGTVIRYTLDGSLPKADSPIWKKSMKIDKTTIVRAATFCDGYLTPFPATHSYIFLGRDMTSRLYP